MEAGAAAGPAAPADGEAQQQQGQQDAQQPEQQQPGLDPALMQSLSELPGTLEDLRGWMEQQAVAAQPVEPGEDPQPTDLSFIDPASPTYDPQAAAGQLLQLLEQQNSQALQQALAPLQQQVQDVQNAREADALAQEFPDLQKPEVADQVFRKAHEWVHAAGLPEQFAGNMQVVRAVYMMGRAAELANAESQQQPPEAAALEGAGGASPGGTSAGQITAESIVGAGRRSVLPFS